MIRTTTKAEGGITDEEKKKMEVISQKWIKNAFKTGKTDKEKLTKAIKKLYEVSGLKEPRVVVVPSPLVMAQAYGLSAGIWSLRKKGGDKISAVSATESATESASVSATDSATFSATSSATFSATFSATYSSTRLATRLATDIAIENKDDLLSIAESFVGKENAQFLVDCVKDWSKVYQGGNMWSPFCAYAEACRDVLGLTGLDCWEKHQVWEDCAKLGGFRVIHEEFCIVSDFPVHIKINSKNEPHSDTTPSHLWADGFAIYHLNGVRFEKELWEKVVKHENEGGLSFAERLAIEDVDQRTQALNPLWCDADKFLKKVNAEKLDEHTKYDIDSNPVNYQLYKIPAGDIFTEDAYYCRFDCPSTNKVHIEGVEVAKTVKEAMAWAMSDEENGVIITPEDWLNMLPLKHEN